MAKKSSISSDRRSRADKYDGPKIQLIVSDDAQPTIRLKPGMKFEVVSTKLVEGDTLKPTKIAARLCGSGSNCMALFDIETKSQPGP